MLNFENLTSFQIDVLREIGNIGSGNAATSFSKMLGKRIEMNIPEVKIFDFKDLSEILGEAETVVVGLLLSITGDVQGFILFILEYEQAKLLVEMLLSELSPFTGEFGELEISVLKEVGNILSASYISALSTLTNLRIVQGVPEIAIDMAGAILSVPAIELGKVSDTVLFIETQFMQDENTITGNFFLVPDLETYDNLLHALGVLD